ncbi:hypothetical protein QQY79_02705 [Flavobacterium tructae]|uniref:hypothetical protein n=1 Tax=Flavobacterium tructae TaxID=1114873 RepID=UPI002551E00C|nr:hypothetical protein [Flavobacterium tructae]MDL2141417.1 hypothetical protein [Flavobacterium tructae]
MNKVEDSLKLKSSKNTIPFNVIYFEEEDIKEQRKVMVRSYQTDSFLPYPCYKPILFYIENEK